MLFRSNIPIYYRDAAKEECEVFFKIDGFEKVNKEKTLGNVLKRLKDKGKLLMLKRYYPNSGKQFSTVFMPYPTIFLQPAFIPMLRIKFGNEKLDKDELSEKYFQLSLRHLDYRLRFDEFFSKQIYQNQYFEI